MCNCSSRQRTTVSTKPGTVVFGPLGIRVLARPLAVQVAVLELVHAGAAPRVDNQGRRRGVGDRGCALGFLAALVIGVRDQGTALGQGGISRTSVCKY